MEYNLIDLGLPSGTLWMDRNIGAKFPTDCGLYFAWGETQGYTTNEVGVYMGNKQFSWTDYKYCNGNKATLTKYCSNSDYGFDGYTDDLIALQTDDDAAFQFTDSRCEMPTKEQITELIKYTTYKWTTIDEVKGGLFTSKTNGNSIFIPAAGYCEGSSVFNTGIYGILWGSSLSINAGYACGLFFNNVEAKCLYYEWVCGFSIRGVKSDKCWKDL